MTLSMVLVLVATGGALVAMMRGVAAETIARVREAMGMTYFRR